MIKIRELSSYQTGFRVELVFQLTQHVRDEQLMKSLIEYLDCGKISIDKDAPISRLIITKIDDLNDKVIPFFSKFPIQGVKQLDFIDFCKAAEIIKAKAHLTKEGLEHIQLIKAGMNRGRKSTA